MVAFLRATLGFEQDVMREGTLRVYFFQKLLDDS